MQANERKLDVAAADSDEQGLDVKIKSKFLSGLGPATSSSSPPLAEAGAKELPFSQEILDVAAADSDEQGLRLRMKSKFLPGLGPATSFSSPPLAEAGANELPSIQEVLNRIASDFLRNVCPSRPEELDAFLRYLRDVREILILDGAGLTARAVCQVTRRNEKDWGSTEIIKIPQEPKEGMQGLALLPVTSLQQETSVTTVYLDIHIDCDFMTGPGLPGRGVPSAQEVLDYIRFKFFKSAGRRELGEVKSEEQNVQCSDVTTGLEEECSIVIEPGPRKRDTGIGHYNRGDVSMTSTKLADALPKLEIRGETMSPSFPFHEGADAKRIPSPQDCLSLIASKYLNNLNPSSPEDFNEFIKYMEEVRKVILVDSKTGSLIITAECSSLEILDELWKAHCTGTLNKMAQSLVTEDVLKTFGLTEVKLITTIVEEEYKACREVFLKEGTEPSERPETQASNRDSDDDERGCDGNKLKGHLENPRQMQQETNEDISKEPSTSSGPGDSRGDLGSAVSGYSSFLSKEVTSLHPESWLKAEDVLELDKLSIVSEPSLKSAHEGESVEGPKDNNSKDPGEVTMATEYKVRVIRAATMKFEAEHEECIRVLPYEKDGHVVVQFYVYSRESGIPKDLKEEARTFFVDMNVKLEWLDLYNNSVNILNVQRLEYSFGEPKSLTASQVDEMNEVIENNLPELSKHRNVTSVQASFKITNFKQTGKPCITIYVLGKGLIPFGESAFPDYVDGYPVDVVNGFWRRAIFINTQESQREAQEQHDVLKLGASIGVKEKLTSGTLGAVVKSGTTFYALSCDHVMKSEKSKDIVHPGLYDHLKYLKSSLEGYISWVDKITGLETKCSLETLSSEGELIEKFEEMKSIKQKKADCRRSTKRNLNNIAIVEKAFEEKLNNPPRKIGEYVDGFNDNVEWTDGNEYYIDAAIAKLSDTEVEGLKESWSAEMYGSYFKPGSECTSAANQAILNANKLCKSGRTTGYTEIDNKILGAVKPPQFILERAESIFDGPFLTSSASVYFCEHCGRRCVVQYESGAPRHCSKCKRIEKRMHQNLWFKRCLCIQQVPERPFACSGDSGSVIFEMTEENNLKGLGILFGLLEHQYHDFILASPLQVVLEALTNKLPAGSGSLELVSKYAY